MTKKQILLNDFYKLKSQFCKSTDKKGKKYTNYTLKKVSDVCDCKKVVKDKYMQKICRSNTRKLKKTELGNFLKSVCAGNSKNNPIVNCLNLNECVGKNCNNYFHIKLRS